MITLKYERDFIEQRLRAEEMETYLDQYDKKYNYIYSEYGDITVIDKLSKDFNKPIINICFDIKPITKQRLQKIDIEKWKKIFAKYNIILSKNPRGNQEYWIRISKYESLRLDDLILYLRYEDWFNVLNGVYLFKLTKTNYHEINQMIHDFVWELENL